MATQSATATATELTLPPPEPIPTVDVEKAVGLVPVDEGKKTELDSKVDSFVAEFLGESTLLPVDRTGEGYSLSGQPLRKFMHRHRIMTQFVGMIAIFVTALWGMYQNMTYGALGQ